MMDPDDPEFQAFKAWVMRWNIGPGMNDVWRSRRAPPAHYTPPKNYTGLDGMVGVGWIPLLDRLAEKLIALGWDRDLHQVKEKFGGLRFYVGETTREMVRLIAAAEEESLRICEFCGAPGRQRAFQGRRWLKTACDECNDGTDM